MTSTRAFKICCFLILVLTLYLAGSSKALATSYVGVDRYETSAMVAKPFDGGSVAICSGTAWPDAISATNLGVPILLCEYNTVPGCVWDALNFINPTTVYIIGGEGVISENVYLELYAADWNIVRLGGEDRYATNILTLSEISLLTSVKGTDYPDALSATALEGEVILLDTPAYGAGVNDSFQWIEDNRENIEQVDYVGGQTISRYVDAALSGQYEDPEYVEPIYVDPLVTYTIAGATQYEWDLMWAIASRESGVWERNSGNGYYGPWQLGLPAIQGSGYQTVSDMFQSHDRQYDAAVKYALNRYGSLEAANAHSQTYRWW